MNGVGEMRRLRDGPPSCPAGDGAETRHLFSTAEREGIGEVRSGEWRKVKEKADTETATRVALNAILEERMLNPRDRKILKSPQFVSKRSKIAKGVQIALRGLNPSRRVRNELLNLVLTYFTHPPIREENLLSS